MEEGVAYVRPRLRLDEVGSNAHQRAPASRAKGIIYGKLAVAVSLEIMDETGVGTNVYLTLPLKIEAEAGYDEAGFCDSSPSPWGISVESSVGAVAGLEAWKELKGDKDMLFDVIIFQVSLEESRLGESEVKNFSG